MSPFQYTITIPPPNGVKSKTVSYRFTERPVEKEMQYTILNYTPENNSVYSNSEKLRSPEFPRTPDAKRKEFLANPANTDHSPIGNYRSVIVDATTNIPLSFSPVKSIPFHEFIQKYPTPTDEIQINEMVEGTMIHLFYDTTAEEWQIATKSAIGGNCWYFHSSYGKTLDFGHQQKPKTFREMFYDALRSDISTPLSDIHFIQQLSKEYSYCFVLQHPDNHFVYHITNPVIILVAVFAISALETPYEYGVSLIPQTEYNQKIPHLVSYNGMVNVPEYMDKYMKEYMNWNTFVANPQYNARKGFMITNVRTGERTKLENPEYLKVKELRGNHPNLQYQYFALLRLGKVREFLSYFPMYLPLFRQLYHQYHTFIRDVHQAYVSYYIHKKTHVPIMKKYFIHIANLHHNVYIPSLATQKRVIKHSVVREYFDQMEPREILYFLHYDETR